MMMSAGAAVKRAPTPEIRLFLILLVWTCPPARIPAFINAAALFSRAAGHRRSASMFVRTGRLAAAAGAVLFASAIVNGDQTTISQEERVAELQADRKSVV